MLRYCEAKLFSSMSAKAKPKKLVEKSVALKPKISSKSAKAKPKKPVEARPRKSVEVKPKFIKQVPA